jgi:glycosyltransferase involved in cell wall biosynthesis
MKLLIIFPGALFPITGMSQVRAVNQLKRLAKDFDIVLTDIIFKPTQEAECSRQLLGYVNEYKPVYAATYKKCKLYRAIRYLIIQWKKYVSVLSVEELTLNETTIRKQFERLFTYTAFDAVLVHYWFLGHLFESLPQQVIRMIDTHYLVEENLELLPRYRHRFYARKRLGRELRHSISYQHKFLSQSDLVIVNSAKQAAILGKLHPDYNVALTVNGQVLDELLSFQTEIDENSILFYGALSNQFNRLALKRLLERIYPALKMEKPTLHLHIVGSNPPGDIISRHLTPDITVTGFVQDIRPVIGKCSFLILPLETGSGFRGRVVEVMALGVPVIGTSNALSSVGITDGVHGFLAESDEKIIEKAMMIINDNELRKRMSVACRVFAEKHFTVEATFGKLSERIRNLVQDQFSDE